MISLTQRIYKYLPTQDNLSREPSSKTLNPKVTSFDFSSFFLLKSSQNIKNEVLNSAHVLLKLFPDFTQLCHDFMLVHSTTLTLCTKFYLNFSKSCPDFCLIKTPIFELKSCPNFTKSYHNFYRISIINF